MHPELFELKALVAGRLDAHRRREIDDHLGSCADCSRHYVALMLGSTSPKTAEAEAREALIPAGAGSGVNVDGRGAVAATVYGIDAPIAPSAPRPAARPPHSNAPALETEFPAPSARTQMPVSASLIDAIAKLKAESVAPVPVAGRAMPAAPFVSNTPSGSGLIEPSIFMPTPPDGVSIVPQRPTPSAVKTELPGFMTRPPSASPASGATAQPELVVTFSSTPARLTSYRSPAAVNAITPSSRFEYVSQAINLPAAPGVTEYSITDTTVSRKPKPVMLGAILGGLALALVLGVSGFKYFKSSVSQAASAAAAAAAKQVEATAARTAAAQTPVAAAPAPAPVQTRVVYVDRPARRSSEQRPSGSETPATAPSGATSLNVALPDINVGSGAGDNALQVNTQRNATTELTRSARATATRTAAPRPY